MFDAGLSKKRHGQPGPLADCEDVQELARVFVGRFGTRYGAEMISEEARWVMEQYDWPGNVAELEDCVEQACARVETGLVETHHLTRPLRDLAAELPSAEVIPARRGAPLAAAAPVPGTHLPSPTPLSARPWDITEEDPISLDLYEKKALLRALDNTGGDKLAAARLLQVGKSTLYRKLKKFGIT